MKRTRFTETQIVAILKETDAGMQIKEICGYCEVKKKYSCRGAYYCIEGTCE